MTAPINIDAFSDALHWNVLCITAKSIFEWQSWVKLRRHGSAMARLVYPRQRTCLVAAPTAVECRFQKCRAAPGALNPKTLLELSAFCRPQTRKHPAAN